MISFMMGSKNLQSAGKLEQNAILSQAKNPYDLAKIILAFMIQKSDNPRAKLRLFISLN